MYRIYDREYRSAVYNFTMDFSSRKKQKEIWREALFT